MCIVEGKGDVEAVPVLCARIFRYLGATGWSVDKNPVRQPRPRLVNEGAQSPNRPAAIDSLRRAVELARARPADAIVVLCDSDDDCAAIWGASAAAVVQDGVRGGAVMAVREFETWLIASRIRTHTIGATPIERIRGAKERLRTMIPRYKPTQHQAQLTRELDIDAVWSLSDSFDKLVRTIARIAGVALPVRPVGPGT